jgi:predicted transcriptional regulator
VAAVAVRRLGELEARVMDVLWRASEAMSVRAVLGSLHGERELAYTTVMTVLDNLHKKGWLRRELSGRSYLYTPAASREEYTARLMADAMGESADRKAVFAHLVEQISAEELDALRAAVRAARRKSPR